MEWLKESIKLKRLLFELPNTTEQKKFKFLNEKNAKSLITIPGEIIAQIGRTSGKRQEQIDRQLEELALLMLHNDDFVKDVIKLARKWQLSNRQFLADPSDLFESKQPGCLSLWYEILLLLTSHAKNPKHTLLEEWEKDVTELLQHGFEGYWRQSLEILLLSGEWLLPLHRTVLKINIEDGYPQIEILIFADTTIKDIEQRWVEVKEWQTQLLNSSMRNKPRVNIMGALEDQPLKYLNMTEREVTNLIKKRSKIKKELSVRKLKQTKTLTEQMRGQLEVLKQPISSFLIY